MHMRILFIADGRSPTANNWMQHFVETGHEVHLVTTYPAQPELRFSSVQFIPVGFSQAIGTPKSTTKKPTGRAAWIKRLSTARMRTKLRQWVAPFTLTHASKALTDHIDAIQPDIIHALRIPYEGMLGTLTKPTVPVIVSVWGNDFTLHAGATPLMAAHTRRTLTQADFLMADCQRDIKLARQWGFSNQKPVAVFPGAGGIRQDQFYPPATEPIDPVIINPRGLRAYVRNDVFFKAIPLVLAKRPNVRFTCPTMADEPQAEAWVKEFGIAEAVDLLPHLSMDEMAAHYRQALVAVSPAEHDGTPNTLLEAMASGCFPIAGDIESVREWIVDGENGFLMDPTDPIALAEAMFEALENATLRKTARAKNQTLIAERATYANTMVAIEKIYQDLSA